MNNCAKLDCGNKSPSVCGDCESHSNFVISELEFNPYKLFGYPSGTPEAVAAVKGYQFAQAALKRVKNTAISMRDRATDNPQGIQAETLAMFADELQLAIKP